MRYIIAILVGLAFGALVGSAIMQDKAVHVVLKQEIPKLSDIVNAARE